MTDLSRLYLLACALVATTCFYSCERSPDSPEAEQEPAAAGATDEESPARTESAGAGERGPETPDRGTSQPAVDVSLEQLTRDSGLERIGDLPERSLPPIPENASRSTGLFEKDGERVGLVHVKYPRDGFARPHVEDITFRSQQGDPVAMTAHGREVIEVRAADADAARRTATTLATRLDWSVVVPGARTD